MEHSNARPRLYHELAEWWPLLSSPGDYAEEAERYADVLRESSAAPVESVLELGSGGGNNASHLKRDFHLTLVDRSPEMLEVSRALNPECEHLLGEMTSLRLGRQFNAVFIHDAVMYLDSLQQLRAAMETAFLHCRPGGVALFVPDCVRETFRPYTHHGGHDGEGRGLRYLEWVWDPDPTDDWFWCEFAYLLRQGGEVWLESDRHRMGLFARNRWLTALEASGFRAETEPHDLSDAHPGACELFIGHRPLES